MFTERGGVCSLDVLDENEVHVSLVLVHMNKGKLNCFLSSYYWVFDSWRSK